LPVVSTPNDRLPRDSEKLLRAIRRIGELEVEKRGEMIGSRRFLDLAEQITALSKEVMYGAIVEERDGANALSDGSTIESQGQDRDV
jgi:hypothetical protein